MDGWMDKGHIHSQEGSLEKLKALAYWERRKIKEVIDDALGLYLKGKKIRMKANR